MNSEIKYESTFSAYPFIIFSFGILFGGIVGGKLLNSLLDKSDFSFVSLLPIGFIALGLLSMEGS